MSRTVQLIEIFDYSLHLPDGGMEGNTTEALLKKRSQPR